ncbi:MAG: PEP-CTERM sorting domain-containing protein [Verrucomicrobia bacterium]|nr:PEP-CTERM sorting domain-containing protein [Verrucomicrobiota bacterium]
MPVGTHNTLFNFDYTPDGTNPSGSYYMASGLTITIVPEPSSISLWVMGAAALGLRRRRA